MGCPESLAALQSAEKSLESIDTTLKKEYGQGASINEYDGVWKVRRKGKSLFYENTHTYAGTTENMNIDFRKDVQVNRISQVWDDATAKDSTIAVIPNPSIAYNELLDVVTANISTSRVWIGDLKYAVGSRLQMQYANYTAGKIVTVFVQFDEL